MDLCSGVSVFMGTGGLAVRGRHFELWIPLHPGLFHKFRQSSVEKKVCIYFLDMSRCGVAGLTGSFGGYIQLKVYNTNADQKWLPKY